MSYRLTSPYGADDLTRTSETPILVEQYIQENWDETKTTVAVNKVKFGQWGSAILSGGAQITLRADILIGQRTPMDVSGRRWQFNDIINVDFFVLNNAGQQSRDPRATKIQKFLEELFIVNQPKDYNGIYTFQFRQSFAMPDPEHQNIDRRRVQVIAIYIADVTTP